MKLFIKKIIIIYGILPRALLLLTVSVVILLLSCLTIKMIDTSCLLNIFMLACWWQENKDEALKCLWKKEPKSVLSHSERIMEITFSEPGISQAHLRPKGLGACLQIYQKPSGVAHIFFFFLKNHPQNTLPFIFLRQ